MKVINPNDIKTNNNMNNLKTVDPSTVLPKAEKQEEEIRPKFFDDAMNNLSKAVERKKYEFAMRRKKLKEELAEMALDKEISKDIDDVSEDDEIERSIMDEDDSEYIDNSYDDSDEPSVKYNISNKYY